MGLIFTNVLTYAGAAVSLVNPFVGLLIYVSFSILRPESLWHWSVPPGGHHSRIVAIALLVGWAARGFGSWRFGRARAIAVALMGFFLSYIVSAMGASHQEVGWVAVQNLGKIVLPFFVGITTIDSTKKLKQLAWVIVLSQAYVAFQLNLTYYQGGFYEGTFSGFGGMDEKSTSIGMVTVAGMALFMALSADSWWRKMVALVTVPLLVHVVMFSYSRGGILGLIALSLTAFLFVSKRPRHFLLFAAMLLAGLRLAGPPVQARFATTFADAEERDWSAQSRLDLWSHCIDVMLKNPITGIGPDHFPLIAPDYGWPSGKEGHSLWLQTGAEVGMVGLLCLASFYVVCIKRLWSMTRERQPVLDPWFRTAARMVITSLAGFAVAAQFITMEGLETPYYITLIGAVVLKLSSVEEGALADDAQSAESASPPLVATGHVAQAMAPAQLEKAGS